MAVTVGTDTWVTVAEADAYFTRRAGGTPWAALASGDKESLIVTAFYWLVYDDSLSLSEGLNDPKVKHAQLEAIWFLLNYREDYERREALAASGVRSLGNRVWNESLADVKKPQGVLAPLIKGGYIARGGVFIDV